MQDHHSSPPWNTRLLASSSSIGNMSGACSFSFESSNNIEAEAEAIGKRKRVDKSSEPTKKRRRTLPDLNEPALPDLNKSPPPEYYSDDEEEQAIASSVAQNSDYDELPFVKSTKRESGSSSNWWGKFKAKLKIFSSWLGMSKNKKDAGTC